MKKDKFVANSILLTLSNLTTGILGFIFSIMISRELGAEGMGLYGLIMPVYNLFICLICGGIITAVSKISAERFAKNDYNNLRKTIKTTLFFNIIWSTIIAFLVFVFSYQISAYFIKDLRTLYALRLTCPAMAFIALSNTLKGYFYGTSKVGVPAFIDITEKAIRIIIIFSISKFIDLSSVVTTVTAAYVALCIGELLSLVLLYIYYRYDSHKIGYSIHKSEGRAQLLFNVLIVSLPLCLNGFFSTALSTVSTLIVPRRLVTSGIEYKDALSAIGKFTGMSLNIVFFPLIVIGSISTVLIPDLSQSMSKKDYYAVEERILSVLRLAFLIGLSTLIVCLVGSDNLGKMFYNRDDLGRYIKFASLAAPLLFTSATTFGILNGLGKQNIILRNSLIVSGIELLSLYILTSIPSINIYGYGISLIITSCLTLIMNLQAISKSMAINFKMFNIIVYLLMAYLLYYIMTLVMNNLPNSIATGKVILILILGFSLPFIATYTLKYSEKRG